MQDFRRNVLGVCEMAVRERTSSDTSMVMYNYPSNLSTAGDSKKIEGMEVIEIDVCCYSSDGKSQHTTLRVCIISLTFV